MKRLVIFDLDGTLLDSLEDIVTCSNSALKEAGFPQHQRQEYLRFIGDGSRRLVERALPKDHRDRDTVQQVLEGYNRLYREQYHVKTAPFAGVLELLGRLKENRLLLAVLTNKGDAFGKQMVLECFPDTFDLVLGQREGIPTKPDPAGVREILKTLGVSLADCCLVGDSDVDIFTAKNVGIVSIGVTWGYRESQELVKAGATALASSPQELGELLLAL